MEPQPGTAPQLSLDAHLSRIETLLQEVLRHSGFKMTFTVRKGKAAAPGMEAPEYVVDFSGADSELLLQKHAALLDALEHVVLKAAHLDEGLAGRIQFDCQDWRWLRAQELQLSARVAAERVLETGDPFALSPMNSRERRIVHLAARDLTGIRTESEGFGPERHVVIVPASSPARSEKSSGQSRSRR
jgi:spoIIIJ-associated protein